MLKRHLAALAAVASMTALTVAGGLNGCRSEANALENVDPAQAKWSTYANAQLQYALEYPTILSPQDYGDGSALFRYHSGVPVLVRYTTEEEGRNRGVWFGHEPVAKIRLGGRDGEKFIYDHGDGPFVTRTIAYVVEYRDRYLGLEFRTDGELSPVQQRILDSFRFTSR